MKAARILGLMMVAMFSVMACGGAELEADIGTLQGAIFNGSAPNAPEHNAVVALMDVKTGYASFFCSGTLIRPNVVLSAAHCLKGKRANKVVAFVGDQIQNLQVGVNTFYGSAISVHPQYNSRTITNDVAMLKLSQNVPGITPVPEVPANLPLIQGERVNFAGFGLTEDGIYGTKLQVDGDIDGFGCSATLCGCQVPPGVTATQFCYRQNPPATGSGPCSGDSGGPAFVYRNGQVYVGGMTSYGDANCTIYGVSTRADAFESFIHGFAGAN